MENEMLFNFHADENRVLLFVDILGFSNQVMNKDVKYVKDSSGTMIADYLSIYKNVCDHLTHTKGYNEIFRFSWMSDSIVLSAAPDKIDFLLEQLVYLHNYMITGGMALRGVICVDDLYHRENIWGKALVRAAKIEKDDCIMPHVIVPIEDFEKLRIGEKYKKYFYDYEPKNSSSKGSTNKYKGFNAIAAHVDTLLSKSDSPISSTLNTYTKEIASHYRGANESVKRKWSWMAKQYIDVIKDNQRIKIIEERLLQEEARGKKVMHVLDITRYLEQLTGNKRNFFERCLHYLQSKCSHPKGQEQATQA